jgi:hypothetical protein
MSTIRFRDLVRAAGTPEPKSLWTDPKEDRDFMRAVKQNRILTVIQGPRSNKKDFGEVGFHQHQHALYFVFPKPLPEAKGKVIGIKYDLVEPREPKDALSPEELRRAKPARIKSSWKEKPEPQAKTFQVLVRRVATLDATIAVEARTKKRRGRRGLKSRKGRTSTWPKPKSEMKLEL